MNISHNNSLLNSNPCPYNQKFNILFNLGPSPNLDALHETLTCLRLRLELD